MFFEGFRACFGFNEAVVKGIQAAGRGDVGQPLLNLDDIDLDQANYSYLDLERPPQKGEADKP